MKCPKGKVPLPHFSRSKRSTEIASQREQVCPKCYDGFHARLSRVWRACLEVLPGNVHMTLIASGIG